MAYELKESSKKEIVEFNTKYGIAIDPEILCKAFEKINSKVAEYESKEFHDDKNKESYKESGNATIVKVYNVAYKRLIEYAMAEYVNNSFKNKFSEKVNCGNLLQDFENMMNEIMYIESAADKYIPLSEIAYGGMSSLQLSDFIDKQELETLKDVYSGSIEGKSVSSLRTEITQDYIEGTGKKYTDYISMAQVIKEKNQSRGFWGRFFHPIDSNREKNMVKALCDKAKERYPQKNVEKDMAEKSFLTEKSKQEKDAMLVSVQNLKKIEFNPVGYQTEKFSELKTKFTSKKDPYRHRKETDKNYREKVAPKIKQMFEQLEKENQKAKELDPNAIEKPFDVGELAKEYNIPKVSAASYLRRYLKEKSEQETLMRDSETYRQNAPKFKDAMNNGGDFTSLKEELGENFDLMKAVFIQDMQKQANSSKEFTEMIKEDTNENLKIDAEVQAEKIVKAKEVASEKTV